MCTQNTSTGVNNFEKLPFQNTSNTTGTSGIVAKGIPTPLRFMSKCLIYPMYASFALTGFPCSKYEIRKTLKIYTCGYGPQGNGPLI
jgi:hypothetical protein